MISVSSPMERSSSPAEWKDAEEAAADMAFKKPEGGWRHSHPLFPPHLPPTGAATHEGEEGIGCRRSARAEMAADRTMRCYVILIRPTCLLAAHVPLMLVFRAGWMNNTFQVTARAATRRTTDGARGAQFMNAPVGQIKCSAASVISDLCGVLRAPTAPDLL